MVITVLASGGNTGSEIEHQHRSGNVWMPQPFGPSGQMGKTQHRDQADRIRVQLHGTRSLWSGAHIGRFDLRARINDRLLPMVRIHAR